MERWTRRTRCVVRAACGGFDGRYSRAKHERTQPSTPGSLNRDEGHASDARLLREHERLRAAVLLLDGQIDVAHARGDEQEVARLAAERRALMRRYYAIRRRLYGGTPSVVEVL